LHRTLSPFLRAREGKFFGKVGHINGDPRLPVSQLLEGDLVYARDFARPENMTGEQWKHLALLAHHCYGSIDLAARAVLAAERIGAVRQGAGDRYLRLLQLGAITPRFPEGLPYRQPGGASS
jgi:hypothetical protein